MAYVNQPSFPKEITKEMINALTKAVMDPTSSLTMYIQSLLIFQIGKQLETDYVLSLFKKFAERGQDDLGQLLRIVIDEGTWNQISKDLFEHNPKFAKKVAKVEDSDRDRIKNQMEIDQKRFSK